MRKLSTVLGIIAAAGGLAIAGTVAHAGGTQRASARPADRFDVVAPVAVARALVADRLAADLPALAAFDAGLGAALAVDVPAAAELRPTTIEPAAVRPAAVRPAAAPRSARVLCSDASGAFRPVASEAACPGSAALQVVAG
jgi:hypothetical protein